ncbi:MAG: winged helix-turn-helix transcriptional regulator [Candidatus Eremiobacteraeota bacterium]|nr:winged helix-turn-helix transcriptional regulator [Candidatus Eremiobacteraeota bacterium]
MCYTPSVTTRAYGQYCGFSRALEVVGERWALLIVRDLLVGPKRFTDLHRGLSGIPTNILTTRLKELEDASVVARRLLPRPGGSVVYELTPYGLELEEMVLALGRWGAKKLGDPRPEEVVTLDSLIMAMRTTFQPQAARKLRATYELRMGEIVLHVRVNNGKLDVKPGPLPDADLVIEAGPAIKMLMSRELTPKDAIANGSVHLTGDAHLLERFADVFQI